MHLLKKYKVLITGIVLGLVGGWAYWYFIGCTSGTCPIKSNPFLSTSYGGLLGALLASLFNSGSKSEE